MPRGGGAPVDVRIALGPEDVAAHHRVRREVFVGEQGIFSDDDLDERDDDAIKVVAEIDGVVVGAVRLYPLDEAGLWKGDRLAVVRGARTSRVGAALVRFAVATAGEMGGRRMLALIQRRNVAFFGHLGWSILGAESDFHGQTHQEMTIPLAGAQREMAPDGYVWALDG